MKSLTITICMAALALSGPVPGWCQNIDHEGQGQSIVTILPKHEGELPASITGQDFSVKVNGRQARVTTWKPLRSPENRLELVFLIDGSARTSLASQYNEIAHFISGLPPNTKAAVAYMMNGSAVFAGPLSADPAQVSRELHITGGTPGSNGTPYMCLSDLAKHWPSEDREARREVVMVTDGVDNYEVQFDPSDPYVQASIHDALQAGLVVYSIYWEDQGRRSAMGSGLDMTSTGQSLLMEVAQATGGKCFWIGSGNPVSVQPFLDELSRRLRNQYELGFTSRLDGKQEVEVLKLKLSAPGTEVDAPQEVMVFPAAPVLIPAQAPEAK
jgi:hypothetical protein